MNITSSMTSRHKNRQTHEVQKMQAVARITVTASWTSDVTPRVNLFIKHKSAVYPATARFASGGKASGSPSPKEGIVMLERYFEY